MTADVLNLATRAKLEALARSYRTVSVAEAWALLALVEADMGAAVWPDDDDVDQWRERLRKYVSATNAGSAGDAIAKLEFARQACKGGNTGLEEEALTTAIDWLRAQP